jgi:hypothetical protein
VRLQLPNPDRTVLEVLVLPQECFRKAVVAVFSSCRSCKYSRMPVKVLTSRCGDDLEPDVIKQEGFKWIDRVIELVSGRPTSYQRADGDRTRHKGYTRLWICTPHLEVKTLTGIREYLQVTLSIHLNPSCLITSGSRSSFRWR